MEQPTVEESALSAVVSLFLGAVAPVSARRSGSVHNLLYIMVQFICMLRWSKVNHCGIVRFQQK